MEFQRFDDESWLSYMKSELKDKVNKKGERYNFDFNGFVGKTGRYIWDDSERGDTDLRKGVSSIIKLS